MTSASGSTTSPRAIKVRDREREPVWWAYSTGMERTPELLEDPRAVSSLMQDGEPRRVSTVPGPTHDLRRRSESGAGQQ